MVSSPEDHRVESALSRHLERIILELMQSAGRAEVDRVLERVKATDAEAYRKGRAALAAVAGK